MDPCKEWEPKVIDNELITNCIDEQLPKGEEGRLAREEKVTFDEVEQIRFEYMSIRIDHLWVLTSLRKLSLNNNLIEKIENLDSLEKLEELDLSFNKITQIENLENLVHLKKLSLYENLISTIENMDSLMELSVFSIAKNAVDGMESILYLRKFPKLRSLNVAANPCAETQNFRHYIAVFLPQLVYYEYRRISEEEQATGSEIFKDELKTLLATETKELAAIAAREKEIADAELHTKSFVEYLNTRHLFDKLFEDDPEGRALLEIGTDVDEFYDEFEDQFLDVCQQIFRTGQEQYVNRQNELDQFMMTVEEAKQQGQEQSIEIMESFMEFKQKLFDKIKLLDEEMEANENLPEEYYNEKLDGYIQNFHDYIHQTWKSLMKLEMELFEQMEDINQSFEHILTDMINHFIEECQGYFSLMRTLETSYTEYMSDAASRYMATKNVDETFVMPKALKPIMSDKEALNNAIGASHDVHLLTIDNREDTLLGRARQWQEELITGLVNGEITRNRRKILEINHFLDIQREEFDELVNEEPD